MSIVSLRADAPRRTATGLRSQHVNREEVLENLDALRYAWAAGRDRPRAARRLGLANPASSPPIIRMNQPPKPRRSGPPHNPGVRELVAGKRRWSSPPKREEAMQGFRGWHERGYLPHRDERGLTQFITFHVADSYPAALRSKWAALLEIEDHRERQIQLEAYLDQGRGECPLRQADIARVADTAFRFYHGKRYDLRAWVVMPNHIHALFQVEAVPLGKILRECKEFTAREANKRLRRRGQFWAEDCWDTYMRDGGQELKTRRYIENNPVKAFLVREPKEWPWSSARFRDENGVLHL